MKTDTEPEPAKPGAWQRFQFPVRFLPVLVAVATGYGVFDQYYRSVG